MILDEYSYISVTEEILNNNAKYSKLDITTAKGINHLGERITIRLRLLKHKKITDPTFKEINHLEERTTSELKLLKYKKIIDKSICKKG